MFTILQTYFFFKIFFIVISIYYLFLFFLF